VHGGHRVEQAPAGCARQPARREQPCGDVAHDHQPAVVLRLHGDDSVFDRRWDQSEQAGVPQGRDTAAVVGPPPDPVASWPHVLDDEAGAVGQHHALEFASGLPVSRHWTALDGSVEH
jgi:hypothetical protein